MPQKTPDLDDLQFNILIRTKKSFKEITHLKNARKAELQQLFKKMGIDFND